MKTLRLDSRQIHPGTFHFDICGGISTCAFAIAVAVCLLHGDIAAIPALLCLDAMTLVVFGVTPPGTGPSTGCRDNGAGRGTCRPTRLLCRHGLE